MVVPKFLELKGPRGMYSQVWMSRADQSFIRTKPKMEESASWPIFIGVPISFPPIRKQPSSNSMSRFRQGANVGTGGAAVLSSIICPFGRRIGVPDTTTDEARPWYPTGRCV